MKTKVIGLIGVKGGGKDFRADTIVKSSKGLVKVFSFSEAVRKYTFKKLKLPILVGEAYEGFKTQTFSRQVSPSGGVKTLTGRDWMEYFGETIKKDNPIQWSNMIDKELMGFLKTHPMSKYEAIIFKDVRHPQELQLVHSIARHSEAELILQLCDYKSDRYDATPDVNNNLALIAIKGGYEHLNLLNSLFC